MFRLALIALTLATGCGTWENFTYCECRLINGQTYLVDAKYEVDNSGKRYYFCPNLKGQPYKGSKLKRTPLKVDTISWEEFERLSTNAHERSLINE